MTNNTIYLKSGDAFIIMWEDSVEIVQPDGNSCIARRVAESKSLVELIKRTPEEVKEIAERYEKSRPNVNNMIPQFKQQLNVNNAIPQFKQQLNVNNAIPQFNKPLNTMTPNKEQDVTTVCKVPKFHGPDGDKLAESVSLELGQKVIRINEALKHEN